MRRTLPMKSDAPIDDAILRRKVMGVRRGSEGPSEAQVELAAGVRKEYVEQNDAKDARQGRRARGAGQENDK